MLPAWVIVTVCPAMVRVPLRCDVDELADARYATVPEPVTDVADVIDSQLLFAAAVHTQPLPAVTVMDPVDVVAATDADVADSTGAHGAPAPACVIVTVCPATVRVPLRSDVDELADARYVTVPEPVTDVADVIDSQLLFAAAVHAQVAPVVTVTDPVDVVAATDADVPDSTGAHGSAPACVIVTVCPATVSVPVRCDVDELADAR